MLSFLIAEFKRNFPVEREITQHITLLDKLDSKFMQINDVIKI